MATATSTIVLIHGAFQDASCWQRVAPLLEARGYRVIAVNLPGRGGDPTPAETLTQATYRDAVLQHVAEVAEPVVLVGHSFGGITVSNVAEAVPERIALAIYLAAYLPLSGESLQSLSGEDSDSKIGPFFRLSPDYKYASIADEGKAALFGNDASAQDQVLIAASMIAEPAGPQGVPVQLSPERFGRVPKAYIRTALDQVVSPMLQARKIDHAHVTQVRTVQAGHGAYITQPAAVATAVAELAA